LRKKKFKIICEVTHAAVKYLQGSIGPEIDEGNFKSTKAIHHLTCLAMESSKIPVWFQ